MSRGKDALGKISVANGKRSRPNSAVVTSAPRFVAEAGGEPDVLRSLREDLIAGVFDPSSRLKQEDLRERYSASVGTLRESLLQLQSDGLVHLETNRGFAVAPVSRADLEDITELRVQFEKQALRDAILHGGDAWEAEIVTSLHLLLKKVESEEATKSADWPTLHRRFHTSLVAACRSPWLLHFRSTLFDQAERYRSLGRKHRRLVRDVAAEHKALADAVLARDADLACDLGEAHIRSTYENIVKNVPGFAGAEDDTDRG